MSLKKIRSAYPAWFLGFLLLLVLLPLPFGANRPWASDLMGLASGALLLWMVLDREKAMAWQGPIPRKRLFASGLGFLLVALWSFFQVLPLAPGAWHHPLWQEAAKWLGPLRGSISIGPEAFLESLIRLLAYVACFLLAFHSGREKENAKLFVKTLSLAGLGYALYGLAAQAAGGDTILWFKKWAYQGFLTSTFVNKNSYAAYAGLGLLCAFAAAREHFKHLKIKDRALAQTSRAAAWFTALSLRDFASFAPPLFILGAMALTGSRAGIASSLFGSLVLLLCMAINRRLGARKSALLTVLVFSILALFIALGGDALQTRLNNQMIGEDSATRLSAYRLEEKAIADNPWLGFGLGAFEGAFRLYRDGTLPLWFHRAHNDYLEMLMDLGIPAALLLFASILLLVSCCVEGVWKRKRGAIYPSLAVAATFLIGTHILVDFSLHIPAIAATYAALLGLGIAQSFSTRGQAKTQKPAPQPAPQPKTEKAPAHSRDN